MSGGKTSMYGGLGKREVFSWVWGVWSVEVRQAEQIRPRGWEQFCLQCAGRELDTAFPAVLNSLSFPSKLYHIQRYSQAPEGNAKLSDHPSCPPFHPSLLWRWSAWADFPPTHLALRAPTPVLLMEPTFPPLLPQETLEGFPFSNTLYSLILSTERRTGACLACESTVVPNSLLSSCDLIFFFFTTTSIVKEAVHK